MFCPRCDTQLAYGARNCPTCNSKVDIRANPGTLHPLGERAKFDMARPKMAVFDIDMTLLDTSSKDRAAIRAGVIDPKGKKLFPKGEAAYDRYMSTPIKRLRTDKPFPGAVNFVKNLMGRGYSIAYVTARPKKIRQNTIEQLESFGFPVFHDYDGSNMVFHKSANDVAEYKLNKLKELSKRYDIDYFFDDLESNRKVAESLGIPGVFDLRERLGVAASNPPMGGLKDVRSNFFKKKKPKHEIPDYGTLVEGKFVEHRSGKFPMPPKTGVVVYGADWCRPCMIVKELCKRYNVKGKFVKILTSDNGFVVPTKHYKDYEKLIPPLTDNYDKIPVIFVNGQFAKDGARGFYLWLTTQINKDEVRSNPLPKPRKKSGKREPSKVYFKRMMAHPKMNNEFPKSSQRAAVALQLVEDNYGKKAVSRITSNWNSPMSNPSNGLSNAKRLYKDFNGTSPARIETTEVHIPNNWVRLGEGGTWSIGYMSGKETGDSSQKYIHNFNEDSKDGNFPDLYAAMNDDGTVEMLIIKGGSMKVESRPDGLKWLVD